MADEEYIIYVGESFTVEWYYSTRGKSPAFEYFESLNDRQQDRFLTLVETMAVVGKIFNTTKFNNEGNGIYAFKPQPDRFLCFFSIGQKIIVTNGFQKKAQKLPKSEKERALRAKADYERRVKEKIYYE